MPTFTAVTEEDLARARADSAFRQRLLASSLGRLIDELQRRNRATGRNDMVDPAQLREGAELAVKLADIISRLEPAGNAGPQAAGRSASPMPDVGIAASKRQDADRSQRDPITADSGHGLQVSR